MVNIQVIFEATDNSQDDFSVVVGDIGELLFEDAGGNLSEMTDEDQRAFQAFVRDITPEEAVEAAQRTIVAAPAFDYFPVEKLEGNDVTATVAYRGSLSEVIA